MTDVQIECRFSEEDLDAAFGFLSYEERQQICPYLTYKEYPAKSVIMRENESSDFMGFLARGRLAVKKETGFTGKYIVLAMLEHGTVVGETEIMGHGPRASTVVAVEDSVILAMTESSLDRLFTEQPVLGYKILKRIIYIISLRLRKAGERLSQLL